MARKSQPNGKSQPRATQNLSQPTQLPREREESEEEEEEEEEEQVQQDEEEEQSGNNELASKANALVRLALFNESRRVPLKREEINKRVLGGNTRAFKVVFSEAQRKLQATFGMELVELASRAGREHQRNAKDGSKDETHTSVVKKKAASLGSKTYILRSTLHSSLLEAASLTDDVILEQEVSEEDDDDDDEEVIHYGSILKWSSADHLGGMGLLHVILSLILVNGRSLNDLDLKKHLKTLRIPLSATIVSAPSSTHSSMTIETYLSTLIRQGYLDKVRIDIGAGPRATQRKRGRGNDGDEEGVGYEWRWGSRADAEVGEKAMGQFIAEFTVEQTLKSRDVQAIPESDDEGNSQRNQRRKRRPKPEELDKMLDNVMSDIVRAAGGDLNEIHS